MNEQKCYVTFRTRCGCTRVQEWFKYPGPVIMVPLPGRAVDLSQLDLFGDTSLRTCTPARRFEQRGISVSGTNKITFYEYVEVPEG